ncbi:C2H2-like zinc finger protein [Euphorbia peplus]|nr:C2H2-like zinc finger protein [Euphorbia peplus]
MERHRCKLCLKTFSNGRALGGHMRSHMLNLPIPQNPDAQIQIQEDVEEDEEDDQEQEIQETESASSSSSSEEDEDQDQDQEQEQEDQDQILEEKDNLYGLRENPKRSIRMVDPEFSSVVLLQDRESETESSKNPTRRRSKRTRKVLEQFQDLKKVKFSSFTESWTEPEQPVSSISDTTTEEDVAFCLMMLSRDNKWRNKTLKPSYKRYEEDEYDEKLMEETEESDDSKSFKMKNRGKYKCETCNKVFKSYQALGGHRASHKKLRLHNPSRETELETENYNVVSSAVVVVPAKKVHECPYCLRVFSSGQALGGHKRSHVTGLAASNSARIISSSSNKIESSLSLIDLNLPAPVEEDDASQIELSAVSDAEFVNHIKR